MCAECLINGSYVEDDVDAHCPVVLRFLSCGFVSSFYSTGTMTFPKPLIPQLPSVS